MDTTPTPPPDGSIVVGIDGSDHAELALDWAARQATLERRPLTLVHATGPAHPTRVGPALNLENLRLLEDREGQEIMQAAVRRVLAAAPDVEVHQILCWNEVRQELLARSEHAAMVVVGSRGRGPVGSLLLGSVSVAVSSHATCPVVVLRPYASPAAPRHGVLVAVQEKGLALATLEFAFGLASSRALPLTVLHCFWDIGYDPMSPLVPLTDAGAESEALPQQPARAEARVVLAEALADLSRKFPDVVVATRQRDGFADRQLVELSPTMDAVVVGSHRSNLLRRAVYGSLAHTVVEHAQGAVVVVPLPANG